MNKETRDHVLVGVAIGAGIVATLLVFGIDGFFLFVLGFFLGLAFENLVLNRIIKEEVVEPVEVMEPVEVAPEPEITTVEPAQVKPKKSKTKRIKTFRDK